MAETNVLVRRYASRAEFERRQAERVPCTGDATTRAVETPDSLGWGAQICDLSRTGVGLWVCFPFKPGSYLAVDLAGRDPKRAAKTALTRVVQIRERDDGTWHLGCEFLAPLTDDELAQLV